MRACRLGTLGAGRPSMAAFTRTKSHGSPSAPRAIITPSQPVACIISTASSAEWMSPLPSTGTLTASFTRAMISGSMPGVYICSRVRACTAMRAAPACSQALAHSTAVMWSASQPLRIFTVTGRFVFATTCSTMRPQRSGSSISLLPAPPDTILGAGQPMLISTKSNSYCSMAAVASPMISGTSPKICTP